MTDSQCVALVELDEKVSKHPEWAGARKALKEFYEHEQDSISTRAG